MPFFPNRLKTSIVVRFVAVATQFVVVAGTAFAQTKVVSNKPAAKQEVVKLLQHSRMAGDAIIYVCSSGIRVESSKGALVTVARAPDWKVYRFNPHTKLIIAFESNLFVNRFLSTQTLTGGTVLDQATVRKTGSRKQFNLSVYSYSSDAAFEAAATDLRKRAHIVNGSYPKAFEMTTLPPHLSSPQAAHVLSVLDGSPNVSAIILDLTCHGFDGKTYKFIRTNDLITVPATPSMFEPPVGYKTVKDQSALVIDNDSTRDVLEIMR